MKSLATAENELARMWSDLDGRERELHAEYQRRREAGDSTVVLEALLTVLLELNLRRARILAQMRN
ncbi:MAG: hypothetical protein AAGI53_01560 [Planctomycetota bacterium]